MAQRLKNKTLIPCRQKQGTRVKKTGFDNLTQAEKRRYEDIMRIQTLLAEGHAPVQVKELLRTTFFRIRRYATGDPLKLCRYHNAKESEADIYKDEIVNLLIQNTSFKQALKQISSMGYTGKRTAFEGYCRKLIAELSITHKPKRNTAGIPIEPTKEKPPQHYVSFKDFIQYLWSGKEMDSADVEFICDKHPKILEIQQCIKDFRMIYNEKSIVRLEAFIEKYSVSMSKPIQSFASGLRGDYEAVKNSVISELSNGFVEGNNNKIKLIKRSMFGRAKIDLLRIKVLFAR